MPATHPRAHLGIKPVAAITASPVFILESKAVHTAATGLQYRSGYVPRHLAIPPSL